MKTHTFHKILLPLASILFLFTSCQKDPQDLLLGTWTVTASEDSLYNEYSDDYQIYTDLNVGVSFTFHEDGTMILDFGDGYTDKATWRYEDDILYMTSTDGITDAPQVTQLTETQLTLYYDMGQVNGHPIYSSMTFAKTE